MKRGPSSTRNSAWPKQIEDRFRPLVHAFVSLSLLANTLLAADLPLTKLDSLSPPAFMPGNEIEVELSGTDLDGVESLWFSDPGITAKWLREKRFSIAVAPTVAEGVYDARAVGLHGASNPKGILVQRISSAKKSADCSVTKPMALKLGTSVYGNTVAATKDHYRFEAKANQCLTIRCVARDLDSKLVPMLAIYNESGRILLSGSRTETLRFVAPKDDAYILALHDLTFGGGADYPYCISVDESPVLEAALPCAVEPGKKNWITLIGRGLPGSIPATQWLGTDGEGLEALDTEIEVPPIDALPTASDTPTSVTCSGLRTFSYRYRGTNGTSNALQLLVLPSPIATPFEKSEGMTKPSLIAKPVPFPGVFCGLFAPRPEGTALEFDSKKGSILVAELFSHRLGHFQTNGFIRIEKSGTHLAEAYGPETNAGGPKLSTLHNDPSLRFEVKEDGRIKAFVSDLSGMSRKTLGANFALVLRNETPDFAIIAVSEPPPETANDRAVTPRGAALRSGATAALRIVTMRSGGYTEAIHLGATNLPEGVQCESTLIPAGKNEGTLILRSDGSLPKGIAQIRVVGRSADGKLERIARGAVARWNVADTNLDTAAIRLTRGDGVVIGLSPSDPPLSFKIDGEKRFETSPGSKVEVHLKVTRKPEFNIPLKLKPAGFAGSETAKEIDLDPKATETKVSLDLAALKLGEGNHSVFFTAQAKAKYSGKDVTTTIYSPAIQLTVAAPPATTPKSAEVKPVAAPSAASPEK